MTCIIHKEEHISYVFLTVTIFYKIWLLLFSLFVSLKKYLFKVLKFVSYLFCLRLFFAHEHSFEIFPLDIADSEWIFVWHPFTQWLIKTYLSLELYECLKIFLFFFCKINDDPVVCSSLLHGFDFNSIPLQASQLIPFSKYTGLQLKNTWAGLYELCHPLCDLDHFIVSDILSFKDIFLGNI